MFCTEQKITLKLHQLHKIKTMEWPTVTFLFRTSPKFFRLFNRLCNCLAYKLRENLKFKFGESVWGVGFVVVCCTLTCKLVSNILSCRIFRNQNWWPLDIPFSCERHFHRHLLCNPCFWSDQQKPFHVSGLFRNYFWFLNHHMKHLLSIC